MNCSRILGKYRLQYDFDDLLLGNAEQYDGLLSMELRVKHPVSVFPSSGVLSIRLDDRTGLSLFGSILFHVVVIFGIGFIAVQKELELFLSALRVTRENATILIANFAAPFDPLLAAIVRHTDILHITRTWHFEKNARLIHQ